MPEAGPTLIITPATAAATALLLVLLAARVVAGRQRGRISLGDGGDARLLTAIRAHANLAEYAPLTLILLLLAEWRFGATTLLALLAGLFLVARLAHVVGLSRPAPNPLRVFGAAGTFTVMLLLAGLVAYGAVQR